MQTSNPAIRSVEEEDRVTQSLGELISNLASQSASLVRDEVQLAKQELSEKVKTLRSVTTVIIAGAFCGLIAVLALCAALIAGLAEFMAVWLAALIVGGVLGIISAIIVVTGLSNLKRANLKPEQTIETMEENKEWLKREIA